MSQRSIRKEEHLALTQMFFNAQKTNSFDQVHLLRPALPESQVDPSAVKTTWFGKELAAPFFINAMTGGSEKSRQINRQLGEIANKQQIALALGSASILTKEEDQLESFYVAREVNPDGLLFANVNPLTPAKAAAKIVKDLQADALQIHLNVAQEIPMPEGDRDFVWLDRMREIKEAAGVPVIVKEVGSGLDPVSLQKLQAAGFSWFDIGGAGGTNFAQIENSRNPHPMAYLNDCGLPTALAALLAAPLTKQLIVSGGVRNPLDVFKGLALGGKFVGVANHFLHTLLNEGLDGLDEEIGRWKEELAYLFALYGQGCLPVKQPYYLDLELKNQFDQLKQYAGK